MKKLVIKELAEKIKLENKAFAKASPEEKRVIIAQDCIARIRAKQIIAKRGRFIGNYDEVLAPLKNKSLKSVLNVNIPECEVCAKGGLFLSYVGRVNDFKTCRIDLGNSRYNNEHVKLLELFSLEQLSIIEIAFEGAKFITPTFETYLEEQNFKKLLTKAIDFYKKSGGLVKPSGNPIDVEYETIELDAEKRLIKICKNIIRNKGTFKP